MLLKSTYVNLKVKYGRNVINICIFNKAVQTSAAFLHMSFLNELIDIYF